MARAGSTTSRTSTTRKSATVKAAEAAADGMAETATPETPAEITAENDFDSTMVEAEEPASTTEVEETEIMSTETVEAPVVSDTTEAPAPTKTEAELADDAAAKATAEAEANAKFDLFTAAVSNALAEHDTSTGAVPDGHLPLVQAAYRELGGAKLKKKAKEYLTERLQDAVNSADIFCGMAVMNLSNLVNSTTPGPKPPVERKPVNLTERFVDELTVLNLAYLLRRNDVPEGVTGEGDEGAFAKSQAKVEELVGPAEAYLAWLKSDAEDKGDEPEVSTLVKRAIKASAFKAAATRASTPSIPRVASGGPKRSVRTHVTQVFADKESGAVLKVAEISNAKTAEYPDGDCSPGAISAALKSEKGIEGFEKTTDANGNLAARKI